jgi:hypothetical protein
VAGEGRSSGGVEKRAAAAMEQGRVRVEGGGRLTPPPEPSPLYMGGTNRLGRIIRSPRGGLSGPRGADYPA